MILILCEESDTSAQWAADALRTRGLPPIVLSDRDLAAVRGWRHTVGARGVDFELELQSGHRLHGRDVRGVLNRLAFLPRAWSDRIGGADRDYAMQEMQAFYLSWLHALPGKRLNPPTPQGLCGNLRHPSAWMALACRAGLPVTPFTQTCRDDPTAFWRRPMEPDVVSILVLGGKVFGARSPGTLAQAGVFATRARLGLPAARDRIRVGDMMGSGAPGAQRCCRTCDPVGIAWRMPWPRSSHDPARRNPQRAANDDVD